MRLGGIESRSDVERTRETARRGRGNFRATARKLSVTDSNEAHKVEYPYIIWLYFRWKGGSTIEIIQTRVYLHNLIYMLYIYWKEMFIDNEIKRQIIAEDLEKVWCW